MIVSFDIGGVISKYPHQCKVMMMAMMRYGIEVHVVTDMDYVDAIEQLEENGFDFIPRARIHSADYSTHGEGCKAVVLREIGAMVHVDDHIGYVAEKGGHYNAPMRLLVMPDSALPYNGKGWVTGTTFGQKTFDPGSEKP